MRKIHEIFKPLKFPIKWGPQRVGPKAFQTASQIEGCFQSSGGPSEWGLHRVHFSRILGTKDVSNQVGAPVSGALETWADQVLQEQPFPIKWGPQRVGPEAAAAYQDLFGEGFQSSGGPSEWGLPPKLTLVA